uniref:Glutamate receptor n=1 Tax=Brassica oleracea var. oleracea TaxID=109376 RepID=A0A0D3BX46_BRAOL
MKREHDLFINLLFLVVVLLMQVGEGQSTATDVKVGIVDDVGMPYSNMTLFCINMSLSDFYSSHPETRTRLVTTIVDSKNDVVIAAAAALDLITNHDVTAIIGPWTSMQAQFMIEIGQKTQVPIVSYSATSPFLASIRSQYFFRATYDDSSQVHTIKAIIKLFGWREVVPVYVDNTFGEAKEIGLMKQGYVWILTNAITDGLSLMNETEFDTMQGVLGVKTYVLRSEELEAFKSRWKNRFPLSDLSVYGLWAYDATTALALAIEESGTSNLTFLKTDAMRNMSGGLGVSQYGPKLFQTLSGVRFKGLAGDFRFINRELQPSVFEIVNVNGHGGRTIGYWMKEHGLLKNVDQTEATMTTFSTWKDRLRPVIWPGDTTFVPKGWEIPTNGKRLKIGVATNSGSPQFVKVTRDPITNSTTFSGFCIEYFEAVIQAMPYGVSYDFFPIEDLDYKTLVYQVYLEVKHYRQFFSCMSCLTSTKLDSLNDSLVLLCLEQKYDAVVGDTTISANRSKYVEFSLSYTPSGVGLVVPVKDNVKRSSAIFLMPLTWGLWLLSLLSFFIIAIVVWVLEHRLNPEFDGPGNYQISTILWFSFSIMVFAPSMSTLSFTLVCQCSFFTYLSTSAYIFPNIFLLTSNASTGERVLSFWARFVVIVWYFLVLVLTQSYTASLASLLTSQQLHPTVTNINSLLEKGEVVGYQRSSFVLERLRESGFSDAKLVNYHGSEHCDELLSKGSARGGISAALMEVPYVRVFLGQYKMVQTPFKVDGLGFVFPIGSPLVADVSRAILKVEESNKANQLENAWFKKIDESCPDPLTGPDPNPSVSFRKLGIDSFWVLFLTAAVRSLCFCIGEMYVPFFEGEPKSKEPARIV